MGGSPAPTHTHRNAYIHTYIHTYIDAAGKVAGRTRPTVSSSLPSTKKPSSPPTKKRSSPSTKKPSSPSTKKPSSSSGPSAVQRATNPGPVVEFWDAVLSRHSTSRRVTEPSFDHTRDRQQRYSPPLRWCVQFLAEPC